MVEVDALADEAIVFKEEEEGCGHFHGIASGRKTGPDALLGSAHHAFHDDGVFSVIEGPGTQPEVRKGAEQRVQEVIHSLRAVDDTAERGNVLTRVAEGGKGGSDVVVHRLGANVCVHNGLAAHSQV